jgi:hypothetical protein
MLRWALSGHAAQSNEPNFPTLCTATPCTAAQSNEPNFRAFWRTAAQTTVKRTNPM